jgi:VWFA-related protein
MTGRSAPPAIEGRGRRVAAAAALLIASASVTVSVQQGSYRVSTTSVPVFATVTNDEGGLVPGLTVDDFEILDGGKPQTIDLFSGDPQPLAVVVMLDTSGSMTAVLDDVKTAAEQFVIRLLPGDRARVCAFNDRVEFMSGFTSDRDELARGARAVDFGNETRLYDGIAASLDSLQEQDHRKTIVVLSDGEDTASRTRRRTIVDRARAEDVMVYGIGFDSQYRTEDDEIVHTVPDRSLRKLAAQTGGGYVEISRSQDLAATFTEVLRELHSQYLLAFSPRASDGRVHHIAVHTHDKNLHVRARSSYLAPAGHSSSR